MRILFYPFYPASHPSSENKRHDKRKDFRTYSIVEDDEDFRVD